MTEDAVGRRAGNCIGAYPQPGAGRLRPPSPRRRTDATAARPPHSTALMAANLPDREQRRKVCNEPGDSSPDLSPGSFLLPVFAAPRSPDQPAALLRLISVTRRDRTA